MDTSSFPQAAAAPQAPPVPDLTVYKVAERPIGSALMTRGAFEKSTDSTVTYDAFMLLPEDGVNCSQEKRWVASEALTRHEWAHLVAKVVPRTMIIIDIETRVDACARRTVTVFVVKPRSEVFLLGRIEVF